MNVRRAILDRLEQSHATLDQLLELDYLDRLITRTVKRMVRHERIEEQNGVYAVKGQLVKVDVVQPVEVPAEVVLEQVVEAMEDEEVKEAVESAIEAEALRLVLDNSVKDVVQTMKTMSMPELEFIRQIELAGKARKSLITAIDKLL